MKNIKQLCSQVEQLENIVAGHPNELSTIYQGVCEETTLVSSEQLQHEYYEKTKDNRLLKIGIVGRVKAGKSSLLNSLLFSGQDILPKAATPMTAALTILSYNDELKAKVDFFTKKDIEILRIKAAEYDKRLDEETDREYHKLIKNEERKAERKIGSPTPDNELRERARRKAEGDLRKSIELAGAKDQIERINNSQLSVREREELMSEVRELKPESLQKLSESLKEYVGAHGRFTPFTRSVEISFPEPKLRDVVIVDTPGFNDPVPSREERARQLLKISDVILILSPAGQFITKQDMDVMERISGKEGIHELYAVATQVDNQLYASVRDECNGDLNEVLKKIRQVLGEHLSKTIIDNRNLLSEDAFDKLIDDGQARVICTSAICQAMSATWAEQDRWDDEKKLVWHNLLDSYKAEFSGMDETAQCWLDTLGNITGVEERLKDVQERQTEILLRAENDFLTTKNKVFTETVSKVYAELHKRKKQIAETNIDELRSEQELLAEKTDELEGEITQIYKIEVINLDLAMRDDFKQEIFNFYMLSKDSADSSRQEKTRTSYREKSGFFPWIARKLWEGGYEETVEEVVSVQTAQIKDSIEDFVNYAKRSLSHSLSLQLKKWVPELQRQLQKCLSQHECLKTIGRKNIEGIIISIIRENIPDEDFDMTYELPEALQQTGKLEYLRAEEYIAAAKSELQRLKRVFYNIADDFVKNLIHQLEEFDLPGALLAKLHEEQKILENDIYNMEMTMDNYDRLILKVKELVNQ